jgi:hypothetical protein
MIMTEAELLQGLKNRFEANMGRHKGMEWSSVQARLEGNAEKLRALGEMERTGGEPDVIGQDSQTGEYLFVDCAPETPEGRRNGCYDRAGEEQRTKKGIFPSGNAVDLAAAIGIELLTEEEYRALQQVGEFDLKTSSWIKTTPEVRKLGGALFMDRRYGRVFVYHNGAQSFYGVRGFRGILRV